MHCLGFCKNQYQGQRRSIWGFEAESQEIGKSGGHNKGQPTTSGKQERAQERNGDKQFSILGYGEIHTQEKDWIISNSMAVASVISEFKSLLSACYVILAKLLP